MQNVILLRNEFLSDPKTKNRLKDFKHLHMRKRLVGDDIENIPVPREERPGRFLHVIRANSKIILTSTKKGVKDLLM